MQIVEYLESTGTQYIDTGVPMSSVNKIEICFQFLGTAVSGLSAMFGRYSASNGFQLVVNTTNSNWTGRWKGQYKVITEGYLQKHTVILSPTQFVVDGVVQNSYSSSRVSDSTTLVLFARRQDSSGSAVVNNTDAKLYYCKIYDSNDEVIRDFIPTLENDIPCLYDQVNNQFYYNQGTGDFSFGDVIESNAYVGVSGVARKVTDIYVGVNNVARKVIKAYVGVYGIARLIFDNTQQVVTRTISKYTSSISNLANSRAPCTGQTQDYAIFGPRKQ